jgi:hypothetical protein
MSFFFEAKLPHLPQHPSRLTRQATRAFARSLAFAPAPARPIVGFLLQPGLFFKRPIHSATNPFEQNAMLFSRPINYKKYLFLFIHTIYNAENLMLEPKPFRKHSNMHNLLINKRKNFINKKISSLT